MDRNTALLSLTCWIVQNGKKGTIHCLLKSSYKLGQNKMAKTDPTDPPPHPPHPKTQGRNYTKAKKTRIEQRTSTGSEVLFVKLTLPNLYFLVYFYRSRMTKIHFRLTWAAQKRVWLSSLICVRREGRERKRWSLFFYLCNSRLWLIKLLMSKCKPCGFGLKGLPLSRTPKLILKIPSLRVAAVYATVTYINNSLLCLCHVGDDSIS